MSYTLVLLRHGESTWNRENLFTGWTDVPLSEKGRAEAAAAGEQMHDAGVFPDVVHTSLLVRAIDTANLALGAMERSWIPVRRSWRLNERHYGALQGLDKKATAEQFGKEQTFVWRRSYDVPPEALAVTDSRHPSHDARYRALPPDVLPATECLADVVKRMLPYWYDQIVPDLQSGHLTLVAAHGNSLRALVKHLEGIGNDAITELNIPTGVPIVYELDDAFTVVGKRELGDPNAIRAAAEAVAQQAG
ncbi:MAG: 2,3-diphosphoglycerate-dependent phosphoglycerate mutase [Acidimicrobiia bacterium]